LGAGKWLGNPCRLKLKQDDSDPLATICFKLKEVTKGQQLDAKYERACLRYTRAQ